MKISFTDAELQDLGINIQPSLDDSRNDDQFEAYQNVSSPFSLPYSSASQIW